MITAELISYEKKYVFDHSKQKYRIQVTPGSKKKKEKYANINTNSNVELIYSLKKAQLRKQQPAGVRESLQNYKDIDDSGIIRKKTSWLISQVGGAWVEKQENVL